MTKHALLRAAAVTVALVGSVAFAMPAQAIINGKPPSQNYSYVVSIQKDHNGDPDAQWCGGALVAPNWVVTAAHCVTTPGTGGAPYTPIAPSTFHARVGSSDRTKGGSIANVTEIKVNPDYANGADRNDGKDLALLRLNNRVLQWPIGLASSTPAPGVSTRLIGWGYTIPNPTSATPLPTQLGQLDSPVADPASPQCVRDPASGSDAYGIREGDFCTRYPDGVSGSCGGDSGSPVLQQVDGQFRLAGLQSRAPGDCGTTPDIDTSVSYYRSWITSVIG